MRKEFERMAKEFAGRLPKTGYKVNRTLPQEGMNMNQIVKRLEQFEEIELKIKLPGKYSGCVFSTDEDLMQLNKDAAKFFAFSDLSHPNMHVFAKQLENEIISMLLNLFKGNSNCSGITTTGGSESIQLAILAHKLHYRRKKGITKPEVIICETAHAAFYKACDFWDIKLKVIPITKNFEVDMAAMESAITPNTVLMVSSCPNYPYGTPDPLKPMADLALKHDFGLHMDCCMGGFLVPFVKDHGVDLEEDAYDFTVKGLTSISTDPHKYGLTAKGISCLLFGDKEIQKSLYFCKADGPGPVYSTATVADARGAAVMAACWATMMYYGYNGYSKLAKFIYDSSKRLNDRINALGDVKVVHYPVVSL